MIFVVIVIIVASVCIIWALGIALAFIIKDNDYLKIAGDSQNDTFKDLRTTIETQNKYIAKLETELRSKSTGEP